MVFPGENPFGVAPLGIESCYTGLTGCDWQVIKSSRILAEYQPSQSGWHHALTDAMAQAEMFERMRAMRAWKAV